MKEQWARTPYALLVFALVVSSTAALAQSAGPAPSRSGPASYGQYDFAAPDVPPHLAAGGQMPGGMGHYAPHGYVPHGPAMAGAGAPGWGGGPPPVHPAGLQGPAMPGETPGMPGMMPGMMPGAMAPPPGYFDPTAVSAGCPMCGGLGCGQCSGMAGGMAGISEADYYRSLFWRGLDLLMPFEGGGCCEQRWYDIRIDSLWLTRDQGRMDSIPLTSAGLGGPIVLRTDDADLGSAWGFRFNAAIMLRAGSNLEFDYFGTHDWSDSVAVTSDIDNLFSVFSDFGTTPFGGFQETDQAFLHSITYESELDNFELGYRRRWVGPFCRFQGSWLAGARYFRLEENFLHQTRTQLGAMDYNVHTYNNLIGAQVGGDLWTCLLPGVNLGVEYKSGIYGSNARKTTNIQATTIPGEFEERARAERVSYVGEAGVMLTYRPVYRWTLRAGYHLLYVYGVALAPENFNPNPPFVNGARTVQVNNSGEALWHGASLGAEYQW